jgi:hypothetical protein
MDQHAPEHGEMLRLLRENNELARQNNALLRKLYRHNIIGFTIKTIWIALLIGVPFAVYFYFLQPYFEAFGANYELFRQGMAEIPGLKGIEYLFPSIGN